MPASAGLVTLDDIRSAADRIRGSIRRTPLLPVDRSAGRVPGDAPDLWLKCECLQFAGAFKLRGAYNFISSLSPDARRAGVVTYSSGNHAQGVAYAARSFGIPALVVMPEDAPGIKVAAVRRLGARLEMAGTTTTDRKARAEELLAEIGGTMVPPFDHPDIIAGQGTAGLEIVEQLEEASRRRGEEIRVATVLVPVGGGGLISGVAAAISELVPDASVIGVEPEGAPKMSLSLDAGYPITLDSIDTIADGLKPVRPGDLTFEHTRDLVERVVTVDDSSIREAVLWCQGQRLVVEPSGAATIAAIASGKVEPAGEGATVAVLSGGNLDPSILRSWLADSASGGPGVGIAG
jgi:threonine dehydratase